MYPPDIPYNTLVDDYRRNFSLENFKLNIEEKFCLIGLIVYLVEKNKSTKPDITYYKVIYALGKKQLPSEVIKGLAVVCEDFSKDTQTYPTYGIEKEQIIPTIQNFLGKYMPF